TSLPLSPDWTQVSGHAGFYGGTYTATRAKNATIALRATLSRMSITAYRCPDCGVLDVYVGTHRLGSLDLTSTPAAAGLWQWVSSPFTDQTSTVTLKVRSRDRLVAIDSF